MSSKEKRLERADDADSVLLSKLQVLDEKQLTTEVLIPLFKSLGFSRVEYTGGNTEEGKDIVCWRQDEFGDTELAIVQVKKYKATRKAADKRSFSEIVTQLSQAIEKTIPHIDGQRYQPSMAYFVSPFPLDTQILQSRFEGIVALRQQRVKVMDGPRIAKLLQQRLPQVAASLCGARFNIRGSVVSQLTNWDLLSALDVRTRRSVDTFYTDIDFCLGRKTTRLLLLSSLAPGIITRSVSLEEWPELKNLVALAREELQIDLLLTPLDEIEFAYSQKEVSFTAWQEKVSQLRESIQEGENTLSALKAMIASSPDTLYEPQPPSSQRRAIDATLRRVGKGRLESAKPASEEFRTQEGELLRLRREEKLVRANRPNAAVDIMLDGSRLAELLLAKRSWIEERVVQFNTSGKDIESLKSFLVECHRVFNLAGNLLDNKFVAEAVGVQPSVQYSPDTSRSRLKISIHNTFDTGLNIGVLGEAGAGKTTNLQMYAMSKLTGNPEALVIYASLGRMVRIWAQKGRAGATSTQPALERVLAIFLSYLGASVTSEELEKEFVARSTSVLLDGIDEAIKFAPWIIESIVSFSERFPRVQVITSSRIAGRYVEDIPFLTISLLPFTSGQRDVFIRRWFHGRRKYIKKVKSHLAENPAIEEVTKTPLLATILCLLEENGVPLPDSEVRLYEERMRLLLGDYDIHKESARLVSKRYHLALIARKIAFRLHSSSKRDEERERLYSISERLLGRELNQVDARLAIDELVDPCNVLVPMTEDGRLGFGHLAYQEFLVAQELMTNRSINLLTLMGQPWWRGVLVMYAKMSDDIEWIVRRLSVAERLASVRDTILAMIAARPQKERLILSEIIQPILGWYQPTSNDVVDDLEEMPEDSDMYDLEAPWYE